MKERPILFSSSMVRAILAGTKTQTRRLVKPQPVMYDSGEYGVYPAFMPPQILQGFLAVGVEAMIKDNFAYLRKLPYGQPGERLWVKETHWWDNDAYVQSYKEQPWLGSPDPGAAQLFFRATEKAPEIFPRWRPSIFMPRWASRITLEITGVRVERLNDCSEEDAKAEGVTLKSGQGYDGWAKSEYIALWESIHGPGSWQANPWVWVIEFKPATRGSKEGKL